MGPTPREATDLDLGENTDHEHRAPEHDRLRFTRQGFREREEEGPAPCFNKGGGLALRSDRTSLQEDSPRGSEQTLQAQE